MVIMLIYCVNLRTIADVFIGIYFPMMIAANKCPKIVVKGKRRKITSYKMLNLKVGLLFE